ncbi:MAG: 50S ribosomal protein L18a [Desulfurococcales archaeon]|nr:50S ribosomal protein L18a [Desulfurococcales archaeon]MCE4622992.1 50S ribosomal protein L18a [Desulfurococcales archaeon]MCE4627413.1 50S ribosomal protein L18a [Desulfurococcales archaeon]MCE4629248.1 50S ribosomal protein L18a [Desulfurococcales archaeon]NOZ30736.1 50S ribosomal protein L18a [Thermoproteota archaeon]
MSDVKIYLVSGEMMLSHDRFPEWRKFSIYVRAVKPEDAIEKVYSDLGSRHKLKRYHIKIKEVKEVSLDEVDDLRVVRLSMLTKWVKP